MKILIRAAPVRKRSGFAVEDRAGGGRYAMKVAAQFILVPSSTRSDAAAGSMFGRILLCLANVMGDWHVYRDGLQIVARPARIYLQGGCRSGHARVPATRPKWKRRRWASSPVASDRGAAGLRRGIARGDVVSS